MLLHSFADGHLSHLTSFLRCSRTVPYPLCGALTRPKTPKPDIETCALGPDRPRTVDVSPQAPWVYINAAPLLEILSLVDLLFRDALAIVLCSATLDCFT